MAVPKTFRRDPGNVTVKERPAALLAGGYSALGATSFMLVEMVALGGQSAEVAETALTLLFGNPFVPSWTGEVFNLTVIPAAAACVAMLIRQGYPIEREVRGN
jgi:hypothetical protein